MSDADAPLTQAVAWLTRGQPEKALDALARLDGAALEEVEPWILRLVALIELERWEEAERTARQGLARFPEDVQLLRHAALVARQQGQPGLAEQYLLAALRVRPEHVGLLCAYAELVGIDGQLAKADALVARAATLAPESDAVLRTRWVLANLRGDDEAARKAARDRLGRDPDDPHALTALAIEEFHAGDTGRARQLYGAALAADLHGQYDPALALDLRLRKHPLWIPMRPIERWGAWKVTIVGIVGLQVARYTLPPGVLLPVLYAWIGYLLYTWIVPPLLRRHLSRSPS